MWFKVGMSNSAVEHSAHRKTKTKVNSVELGFWITLVNENGFGIKKWSTFTFVPNLTMKRNKAWYCL